MTKLNSDEMLAKDAGEGLEPCDISITSTVAEIVKLLNYLFASEASLYTTSSPPSFYFRYFPESYRCPLQTATEGISSVTGSWKFCTLTEHLWRKKKRK